jgi:hypothetical protein
VSRGPHGDQIDRARWLMSRNPPYG